MHRSPDSIQVAPTGRLLPVTFVLVLAVAAVAGVLVTASVQAGLAALGFALVAGPVAVVVEARSRDRGRDAPRPTHPVASVTRAARV